MSIPTKLCAKCGTSSWLYAEQCPGCREPRWVRFFKCIHPSEGEVLIPAAGLTVIPVADGTVRLIQGDPETGSWETIEKPFGDTPVKGVGWFYVNEDDWEKSIPSEEFPKAPEETVDLDDYISFAAARSLRIASRSSLERSLCKVLSALPN